MSNDDALLRARQQFDASPLHRAFGLSLESCGDGRARIGMTPDSVTSGGIGGSVHGGVLAALVDIAMLQAMLTLDFEGKAPAGTADLSITYLRPAFGPRIYADASIVKNGRQLALVEVDITDSEGRLCARGRTLYAFRALPAPDTGQG